MKKGTRVRIVAIHKNDSYSATDAVGHEGSVAEMFGHSDLTHHKGSHWLHGAIQLDIPLRTGHPSIYNFYKIKVEKI